MDQHPNPYAPPKHDGAAAGRGPANRLDAIRREHIDAEANITGLGALMYLGAGALILGGLARFAKHPFHGVLMLAFGAALGVSGYWLRRFDRRGRLVYSIVAILFVVLVLVTEVIGGIEHPVAYQFGRVLGRLFWPLLFMAILWGSKATTVLTPHYRDVVIPATTHIHRTASRAFIVAIALLLVLLIAAMIFANAVG